LTIIDYPFFISNLKIYRKNLISG